jgi:hypothetical protein
LRSTGDRESILDPSMISGKLAWDWCSVTAGRPFSMKPGVLAIVYEYIPESDNDTKQIQRFLDVLGRADFRFSQSFRVQNSKSSLLLGLSDITSPLGCCWEPAGYHRTDASRAFLPPPPRPSRPPCHAERVPQSDSDTSVVLPRRAPHPLHYPHPTAQTANDRNPVGEGNNLKYSEWPTRIRYPLNPLLGMLKRIPESLVVGSQVLTGGFEWL